jgi:hypothetical protein
MYREALTRIIASITSSLDASISFALRIICSITFSSMSIRVSHCNTSDQGNANDSWFIKIKTK